MPRGGWRRRCSGTALDEDTEAFAGALGLRLAGPRRYHGAAVEDAWMGDGRADATPEDIRRALALLARSCLALAVLVVVVAAA